MDSVRVDRWLCATRLFKSRNLAQEACEGGHIAVNDETCKPSRLVRPGDVVTGRAPRGEIILVVRALEEKRQSSEKARTLYEDQSPPPPPKVPRLAVRDRGAGRPTKSDRRAMDRLRSADDD